METIDLLGSLEGVVFYRVTGKQGIDYDMQVLVTDFQGRSWRATFTLQEVFNSLDAYEPEEEELLQWIKSCLDQPRKPPRLMKGPGGRVQALQGFHTLPAMSQPIRLLFPPEGDLEEVQGKRAHVDVQELAGALFAAYSRERTAAAAAITERDDLRQELADMQAACEKLQERLQELNPAALKTSGSFKRHRDGKSAGTAASGMHTQHLADDHSMDAPGSHAPSTQAAEKAAAKDDDAKLEGVNNGAQDESAARAGTGIGRAKVVRGRGRGRALPSLTAKIGGSK